MEQLLQPAVVTPVVTIASIAILVGGVAFWQRSWKSKFAAVLGVAGLVSAIGLYFV